MSLLGSREFHWSRVYLWDIVQDISQDIPNGRDGVVVTLLLGSGGGIFRVLLRLWVPLTTASCGSGGKGEILLSLG